MALLAIDESLGPLQQLQPFARSEPVLQVAKGIETEQGGPEILLNVTGWLKVDALIARETCLGLLYLLRPLQVLIVLAGLQAGRDDVGHAARLRSPHILIARAGRLLRLDQVLGLVPK